jgi:glycine hydroxymethyltransferase
MKFDKVLKGYLQKETKRQKRWIELIASENLASKEVLKYNGSILTNKYSEGQPGKRYYNGNKYIDAIENLCKQRALELFDLKSNEWHVNVQSYSGSTANFCVYTALLKPGDTIMGLDLPSGGHLSHGYVTKSGKKLSNASIYYNSVSYSVDDKGYINYSELKTLAEIHRPKMIIAGGSALTRDIDYKRFRYIADMVGAFLLCDISHISGFIATKLLNNPFCYADVCMTTTHKILRGPRAALIYCKSDYANLIDSAVFPGAQGGPHNNTIAAVATALYRAKTVEYKEYCEQTIKNTKAFCKSLKRMGHHLISDGSDNHCVLWDTKSSNIPGYLFSILCEKVEISLNMNCIPGDKNALKPSGVRIGTQYMTSRGFVEEDFIKLSKILNALIYIGLNIINDTVSKEQFKEKMNLPKYEKILKNIIKQKNCLLPCRFRTLMRALKIY